MLDAIYIAGIVQGILLSIVFFNKGRSLTSPFFWLGNLIGLVTIIIIGQLVILKEWHQVITFLFIAFSGAYFLIGPFLYFFIKTRNNLIKNRSIHLSVYLIHFLPFTLYIVFMSIWIYSYLGGNINSTVDYSTTSNFLPSFNVIAFAKLLHVSGYLVYILKIYFEKSTIDKMNFVFYFIVGYAVLQIVAWTFFIINSFFPNVFLAAADNVLAVMLILYIYLLGYIMIKKSDLLFFSGSRLKKKYTGGLNSDLSAALYKEITAYMDSSSLYEDPNLKIDDLAQILKMKSHHISQAINENGDTNFKNFVNNYRLAKVKRLIMDPKYRKYTVLAIAFMSGFNNKNSFNVMFKKHTGLTPTAYRKNQERTK